MNGTQCENGRDALVIPTLSAALGPKTDNGFIGPLGGPAADGQAGFAQRQVSHVVFVILDEGQVVNQHRAGIVGVQPQALLNMLFDVVDRRIVSVESELPLRHQGRAHP